MWRRNFSSRARELSGGDALVISIPKSGRTWVRTFLSAYFCGKTGQPFVLDPWASPGGTRPRLVFTHDIFEHRTKGDRWARLRGKYLVPRAEIERARRVLLARDPRDAFVSHYVQLVHRSPDTPAHLKALSVSQLLRHPAHGIRSIIEIMNGWRRELRPDEGKSTLVRYEDLRADPPAHFRRLLHALGEETVEETALAEALEFSSFANMKRLEDRGAFASKILRPADRSDPESYKVRRGKIGGFADYLTPADQEFAAAALAGLDPLFGYRS